jgi:hypothetical protein
MKLRGFVDTSSSIPKAGLVNAPEEFPWSSARFRGVDGGLQPARSFSSASEEQG